MNKHNQKPIDMFNKQDQWFIKYTLKAFDDFKNKQQKCTLR